MRKIVWLAALMLCFSACRYKELCYDHNHEDDYNMELELSLQLDLDVDVEVSDESHTKIRMPNYLVVNFYDPLTGALQASNFVGSYGGPLHVNPGTYQMVLYSFDTEWTWVRGETDIRTLEAYTSDITATKTSSTAHFAPSATNKVTGPIIYTPDHLLVTQKEVVIPPYSSDKKTITISATAKTIVETYSFEVRNIKGLQYVASVEAYVTNQSRSAFFGRGVRSSEPATIFFPIEVDRKNKVLKTAFNTFGKLPGESHCFLHILLTSTDGHVYTLTEDITEQFTNPDHQIVIENEVEIPEPEQTGGGIAPTVDEWEEVDHDVPIG